MYGHGTFCGQTKPISIFKVLSILKIAEYGQERIRSSLHSQKVTVWCGFTAAFIVGRFFFEEIGPSDTDDEDTNDTHEEQGVTVTTTTDPRNLHLSRFEVNPEYNDRLQKVRKVAKLFKRLPAKYDMHLQKYVKEDTGKELSLILDYRTRWNSLLVMIERFYELKVCIDKALIDIGSDTTFRDLEWSKVKDLIESLQPFQLAVEALCRRDSTLLTAETTLKFILEKLVTQDTMLSVELSKALRVRIKERSTVVTGILIYLQNPKKMMMIQDELMIHLLCRKKYYTTRCEKYLRKSYSR
ncbi:hypothetical protein AVEN_7846-1 [Araneus ventricosus]|uniref:Uncharacterized protein n=1 Tax=Araneus ventricosus TaxID=182803 RepID=A0A4Y2F2P6_ARAVE|nr:hypothetical protein AVEN_7846-1 [Araneus ventricosus]